MNACKIDIKNFSFFYGSYQVLFNVNMPIHEKKVTAVIGPSGCGKSTMLRSINRMNDLIVGTHVTGEINMNGKSILSHDIDVAELRRHVGMVFQKPNPFPKSIYKNIIWGPKVNGIKANYDDLVEQSLKRAALWDEVKDRLHNSAMELSGGQQQRLCIARAVAMSPDVILMDEPCSALDPRATLKVEELIHELKELYTIVIVTHNMQQARRVSEETAFFYEGKMLEMRSTQDLFHSPTQKETRDYIEGRVG